MVGASLVLLLAFLPPIGASGRPVTRRLPWVAFFVAGILHGGGGESRASCSGGDVDEITGYLEAVAARGVVPFRRLDGRECTVRVAFGRGVEAPPVGRHVGLRGRWREGRAGPWFLASDVGEADEAGSAGWRGRIAAWRHARVERLHRLFGDRGPLVSALILARKEGLDPGLREAFARTGIAHLFAISGFHVGVVAGLVMSLLSFARLAPRQARLAAAGVIWVYVGVIGFPAAACRAATIMTLVGASQGMGRPPAKWGALGAAFLGLCVVDPGALTGAGFQLSFAGAAGLVAWARPIERSLPRPLRSGRLAGLGSALSAGVAATIATLPVVAWHFERVSVVGIPTTLLASPLVALAVPGALGTMILDPVVPGVAAFLAGGVDLLLVWLSEGVRWVASWESASLWTPREWVVVGSCSVILGGWLLGVRRLPPRVRAAVAGGWVAIGVLGWPLLLDLSRGGTLDVVVFDVGQGDAIAVRTPGSRWVLVDAGPAPSGAAESGVVQALRRRGARRLDQLVLTHADADHIGGAPAVLAGIDVVSVADPGIPVGKPGYVGLLEEAERRAIPWRTLEAGDGWRIDGVDFQVLGPIPGVGGDTGTNDASIVLLVRYGAFEALLTGDAPSEVEEKIAEGWSGDLEVLKVGHHGSTTSTAPALLEAARPQLSVISVGRGNRYGHPDPSVLARLRERTGEVLRTDRDGTITVRARSDGTFTASGSR